MFAINKKFSLPHETIVMEFLRKLNVSPGRECALKIEYSAISRSTCDYFHISGGLPDQSNGASIGGIVRLSFTRQNLSKTCLPDLFVHVVASNTTMPFK